MYSRETLARRVAEAAAVYESRSRWLAAFSIAGGVGQLWLHRILERRYDRAGSQPIELAIFVVYIVIVAVMMVWLTNGAKAALPRCDACGAPLTRMSGRLALATGRCDQCGAQVIE